MANTKMTYSMALDNALAVVTDTETREKLMALKTSLAKKHIKQKTEKDKANEAIMDSIANILSDGSKKTVTEIMVALGNEYTSQKVTALVRKMKGDGTVGRTVDSRVAYFSLASDDTEEEEELEAEE